LPPGRVPSTKCGLPLSVRADPPLYCPHSQSWHWNRFADSRRWIRPVRWRSPDPRALAHRSGRERPGAARPAGMRAALTPRRPASLVSSVPSSLEAVLMARTGSPPSSRARRAATRRFNTIRSLLERLEDRTVPAFTNAVVNNPAADLGSNDTQSETSLVLAGSTVVVAFNDSGSNAGNNKFTGFAQSLDGGASFTDRGTLPTSSAGDAGDPALARDAVSGTIYLATLGYSSSNVIQVFRSPDGGATCA